MLSKVVNNFRWDFPLFYPSLSSYSCCHQKRGNGCLLQKDKMIEAVSKRRRNIWIWISIPFPFWKIVVSIQHNFITSIALEQRLQDYKKQRGKMHGRIVLEFLLVLLPAAVRKQYNNDDVRLQNHQSNNNRTTTTTFHLQHLLKGNNIKLVAFTVDSPPRIQVDN